MRSIQPQFTRHGPSKRRTVALRASSPTSPRPTYVGRYGTWTLEPEDVQEVNIYRGSLSAATLFAWIGAAPALLALDTPPLLQDAALLASAASFGVSLQMIHIYMSPIKKTIQLLWGIGFASMLIFTLSPNLGGSSDPGGLLARVWAADPWSSVTIGPFFAALTALGIKEGLCYGKREASALAIFTPTMMLLHIFTHLAPLSSTPSAVDKVSTLLLLGICSILVVNKYSQRLEDDLGDKSIFDFMKLSPSQQEERMAALGMTNDDG